MYFKSVNKKIEYSTAPEQFIRAEIFRFQIVEYFDNLLD